MSNFVVTLTVEDLKTIIREEIQKSFKEHSPKSPVKFLTAKQTCILIGISRPTLTSYTKQGKLIEHRIGRKVTYKQSEVEEALLSLKKYKPFTAA